MPTSPVHSISQIDVWTTIFLGRCYIFPLRPLAMTMRMREGVGVTKTNIFFQEKYITNVLFHGSGDSNKSAGNSGANTSTDCSEEWMKHKDSCYYFSNEKVKFNWNNSREECFKNKSDLVIINDTEELDFLNATQSEKGGYYFIGMIYSGTADKEWIWINKSQGLNKLLSIKRDRTDHYCAVIGFHKVTSAHCEEISTSLFLCEKKL
uniref:C-type lectin domain-containing protein n=1 Tax=Sphenodon punctatus TaxID=8508 RepID=A0A8D0GAZ0_SPHPU